MLDVYFVSDVHSVCVAQSAFRPCWDFLPYPGNDVFQLPPRTRKRGEGSFLAFKHIDGVFSMELVLPMGPSFRANVFSGTC